MRKLSKNSKKNIATIWIISYLCIMLVPVAVNSVGFLRSIEIFNKEILKGHSGLLEQLQTNVDGRLVDLHNTISQLGLSAELTSLANAKRPLTPYQQMKVITISRQLGLNMVTNSLIKDMYIYVWSTDTIITSMAHEEFDLYYWQLSAENSISEEDWRTLLRSKHNFRFIRLAGSAGAEEIAILHSFYTGNAEMPFATMVLKLSEDKFQEMLKSIVSRLQSDVVILDENLTIITTTVKDKVISLDFSDIIENGAAYQQAQVGEHTILYAPSQQFKFHYLMMTPKSVVMEGLEQQKAIIIYSLIICIIMGVLVIYIVFVKNYGPLRRLVNELAPNQKLPQGTNEYKLIQDSISQLSHEKEEINKRLKKSRNEIRSNFLQKLLHGRIENAMSAEDAISAFDITFRYDCFAVALLSIGEYTNLFREEDNMDVLERYQTTSFIVSNVMEDLTSQQEMDCHSVELDELVAFILSVPPERRQEADRILLDIIQNLQAFISQNFSIGFTAAVGKAHEQLEGIHISYLEAMDALEYQFVAEKHEILSYRDIEHAATEGYRYTYSLDMEYKLLNCIRSGNGERAKEIIENVLEESLSAEHIDINIVKCLMFNLVGTLMKALNEIKTEESLLKLRLEEASEVLECENIRQMKERLLQMLETICGMVSAEALDTTHDGLTKNIQQYIQQNYANMDLSIALLGEAFHKSPSYLGKLFKKEMDCGILDYINEVRIQNAKTMLKETSLSIQEVSGKAGFSSSTAFIRIFKKLTGITPGEYRKLH